MPWTLVLDLFLLLFSKSRGFQKQSNIHKYDTCLLLSLGAVEVFCKTLLQNLSCLPGDARTMVGFLTYDHCLHFYNLNVWL